MCIWFECRFECRFEGSLKHGWKALKTDKMFVALEPRLGGLKLGLKVSLTNVVIPKETVKS